MLQVKLWTVAKYQKDPNSLVDFATSEKTNTMATAYKTKFALLTE